MRRLLLALVLAVSGVFGVAMPAGAVVAAPTAARGAAATPLDGCSADFFDGDARLGPAAFPVGGNVGLEVAGYRRTGGLADGQFLATYYDPAANGGRGGWIYPPANGYVVLPDGTPIEWQMTLVAGEDIDRFGSEYGSFLAPEFLPYANRAIPPQNLDGNPAAGCNYHDYRVLKAFAVDAGPIAAWFAQPGGGLQYQLDASLVPGSPSRLNVLWLVGNGYLERLN